jgi:hypothetical protein
MQRKRYSTTMTHVAAASTPTITSEFTRLLPSSAELLSVLFVHRGERYVMGRCVSDCRMRARVADGAGMLVYDARDALLMLMYTQRRRPLAPVVRIRHLLTLSALAFHCTADVYSPVRVDGVDLVGAEARLRAAARLNVRRTQRRQHHRQAHGLGHRHERVGAVQDVVHGDGLGALRRCRRRRR